MDAISVGITVYLTIGATFLMQRTLLKLARNSPFARPLWLLPVRIAWFIAVSPAIFFAAMVFLFCEISFGGLDSAFGVNIRGNIINLLAPNDC